MEKSSEIDIKNKLVEYGERVFNSDKQNVHYFVGEEEEEVNEFLNDLENYPHAFLIACLCDKQIKAERAWKIPFKLKKRIGNFEFSNLFKLTEKQLIKYFLKPSPLHRFKNEMAKNTYSAIQRIGDKYAGDASKIWKGIPSSAEVVYRFLEFNGMGPKIATMATNILARDLKIRFKDYYSLDISADSHVKRVFWRLGLVKENPKPEEVIYKARGLYPKYPGILDISCWKIGRKWCGPKEKKCDKCFMNNVCPSKV